jgi:hypothetical protein
MEEENLRCYVRIRPNPQQKKKDCISYDDASSNSGMAPAARDCTSDSKPEVTLKKEGRARQFLTASARQ